MVDYDAATHGDVDIIFAGGGTTACVAAGRLAKSNPHLKILLIEAGAKSFENPSVRIPALFTSHLMQDSKTTIFYTSQPSKDLNGRQVTVAAGGTLGGGSAINFMMYSRAQAVDFDSWNVPGWSSEEMIPLCNKIETFWQGQKVIEENKHGYDGPVHISEGSFKAETTPIFLKTVEGMQMKTINDLQDFNQVGGFSEMYRYVSRDGNRQDAAYCYVYPLLQDGHHPNLFILAETKVVRVLFDPYDTEPPRAIGVELKPSNDKSDLQRYKVMARKLVVVSAGALGTPQILERSGIGGPEILREIGIPIVAAVSGVGEQYQDHLVIRSAYKSNLDANQTLDGFLSGREDFTKAVEESNPLLGWNGLDVCGKLRMTDAEVKSQDSQFRALWLRDFTSSPTRPLIIMGSANGYLQDQTRLEPGQYVGLTSFLTYPYSRGRIHITSPDDVASGYSFDSGFLNHEFDLKALVWAYKKQREIARRLPYCTGEVTLNHPKFHDSSEAKLGDESYSATTPSDIVYTKEDEAVLEDWVRQNVSTTWHSLGTCSMKPLKDGGVVDAGLNVYGTKGLKVADLSIVPRNVGANTNNTALVVGEKAALIIASELRLQI